MKIKSLSVNHYKGYVYDISIPETRNLFVNDILVHNCAVWVAKKKYAMKVWNSEGVVYNEPEYKVMGLEAVKSSTPAWARTFLFQAYEIGLNGSEGDMVEFVKHVRTEFNKLSVNDIAIPTGVNGLEKYHDPVTVYKKGAQAHVKAALFHNKLLKDLNLQHIEPIRSGNKMKYILLCMPNTHMFDVVGFEEWLPPEFNLDAYIDRELMFEKGFLSRLVIFNTALEWDHEERISLEDFFS